MKVTAYKTPLITSKDRMNTVIANAIPHLPEQSFLVIASKIVSTCENRFVPKVTGEKPEKWELVKKEAEWYTDPHSSKYNLMLTRKRNWMFVNAGIDESNSDNQYILWPEDPQKSVNQIWQFVRKHYKVKEVGVIITDSSSIPLNWGVIVHGIAYCGFWPLRSYIGKPDLFGREMKMEQVNIMQSIAAAGGFEMGEGAESTPLAVVRDVKDIQFQDHIPTADELAQLRIELEEDAYAPLLTKAEWFRGESK
jgi:F420-0:gamma-glutamyl ligase